jgi:tetratricopeptide (TPR) repeat protein
VDSFGSVTNFYPFLSEDTRTIVEAILKQAEGYDDFVSKMVDIVLTQDETTDLTHFTVIQTWFSGNPNYFNKLRPRFREDVVLKPWLFNYFEGSWEEFDAGFPPSLDKALESVTEGWIRLHLLLSGVFFYFPRVTVFYCHSCLEKAKELIESQPDLECYSAQLHIAMGGFARYELDIKEAMKKNEKAMEIAEHYDDVIGKHEAQVGLAWFMKDSDASQALALLDSSYQAFRSLGANEWASIAARHMGTLHSIIGEYDLAVEFRLEASRISEPAAHAKWADAVVFSQIYCNIDLPEEALEWTKNFMDWDEPTSSIVERVTKLEGHDMMNTIVLSFTRSLIQLGELEGVPQILSEMSKQVFERGEETTLMLYTFVSGLYEVAIGNLDAGFQNMSDALTEAERFHWQVYINSILLELTKAEVKHLKKLESSGSIESSGQWMTRLGIHARKNDYPGIRMLHALLKAEYQEKLSESEAATLTLQDALTFSDSLGVKTLRERILKRLDNLETSAKV